MPTRKVAMGCGALAALAAVIAISGGFSRLHGQQAATAGLLVVQKDKVIEFNRDTGVGIQIGTATGQINGVSINTFKFTLITGTTDPPLITFDNHVGITDTDGDQIIFHNVGNGHFVVPPLTDKSLGASLVNQPFGATPIPCPGEDTHAGGSCAGVGGPLIGTYVVEATSGKYVNLFPLGKTYPYRGVAYNPSSPPASPNDLGFVYVEVQATPLN